MPRTIGAKSHLANITLASGPVKFPRVFLERMQSANYKPDDMRNIVKHWLSIMASNGYSAAAIDNQRETISENADALNAFVGAISTVTGTAIEEEEVDLDLSGSDENAAPAEAVATAAPVEPAVVDNAPPEPEPELTPEQKDELARKNFTTDANYFHGMKRHIPPMAGTARLGETYVNGDDDKSLDDVIRVITSDLYPVRLVGDAGAGKTFMGKYISSELGLPYYQVSCDTFTEYDDFFGKFVPDGQGGFYWSDGPVTMAAENGGIVVIEEYNMVKQAVLAALREILTGGELRIRTAAGIRVIPLHKDFRIMATMNPKDYAGTNELSLAEMDRFVTFKWDYPSKDKEIRILEANAPGFPPLYAEKVIEFANETRNKKKNDPDIIRYVCSTRTVVKIARLYTTLGWSLRKCVEAAVLEVVGEVDGEEFKYIEGLVNARFPQQDQDLNATGDDDADPLAGGISL